MARTPGVAPGARFIRYTFRLKETGKFVRPDGTKINLSKTVAAEIAQRMLQAAVRQLDDRRRREEGTGNLRRAILSEENYSIGPRSVRMFNVPFLDREVRYWRAIDQGLEAGFVGRVLPGFFHSGGEISAPGRGIGQQFRHFPREEGGMKAAAQLMWRERTTLRPGRPFIVVQRPIEAVEYVAAAREAFKRSDADEIARSVIAQFKLRRL